MCCQSVFRKVLEKVRLKNVVEYGWYVPMTPDDGLSIVPSKFSSVVLPPPDGPLNMTNSPLSLKDQYEQKFRYYLRIGYNGVPSINVISSSAFTVSFLPAISYANQIFNQPFTNLTFSYLLIHPSMLQLDLRILSFVLTLKYKY